MINQLQPLSQRIARGRLSVGEGLRLAVQLGDALRRVHDEGRIQGELTPDLVMLNGSHVELMDAEPGAAEAPTPYTAPELLQGHAPDVRTDIFAYGAVMYEMLTGRRAFEGDTPEALAESISTGVPAPIEVPEFDRLVSTCLSKDPAGRWQRMQHVITEARLAATMCRAEKGASTRDTQIKALRAEVEQLEARLVSQLDKYESVLTEMHTEIAAELSRQQAVAAETSSETLESVRARFTESEGRIEVALGRAVQAEHFAERALGEVEGLRGAMSEELGVLETKVKAQTGAIESSQAGIARTDDLVERVVEALEVLQGMVLDHNEERAAFAS